MVFHPVIDQPIRHVALDPLVALFYIVVFAGIALLTLRRPAYGVCALIVVQPFALYRDVLQTTVTLPKVALVAVALALAAWPGVYRVLKRAAPRKLLVAGLLVFAATVLSFAQADYREPAIREALKVLQYLATFAVVAAAYSLDPDRALVRRSAIVVTLLVAALALSQELLGAPSGLLLNGHATPRIAGPLEGPNQLAGYFEISLALLLAFAIERYSRPIGLTLAVCACADVLTFSRGGMAGAIVAIAIVCAVFRRNLRAPLTSLGFGAVAGTVVAASWGVIAHSLGVFRLWSFDGSDYAGGVGTRPKLWHAAYVLWRAHPWFGIGAGNFELELPRAGLTGIRTHANSLYLQALVEGGIPQFAATLYLTATSMLLYLRDAVRSPIVAAALAASAALAVHQVADYLVFYPKVGGWWWILLGLAAVELPDGGRRDQ